MTNTGLQELQELARRDEALAAESEQLRTVDARVAEIRTRAEAIAAFFAGHAEHDERLRHADAREASALEERRAELLAARAELERARSDEERLLAEKQVARAADHVALAERALEQVRAERRAFEEEAERLTRELPELQATADAIGAEGDDLIEWTSRKHAELFVALGQLDAQRERAIREANELATAMLGEPTFGLTAAQALARAERSADQEIRP